MNKLFDNFKPVSKEEWVEKIKKDLKGKELKKLMHKTIDGLTFEPFYRKEDIESLPTTNTIPGKFPFLRGYKQDNKWKIRHNFLFKDLKTAEKKFSQASKKDIDIIGFDFGKKFNLSEKQLQYLLQKSDKFAFSAFENIEDVYFFLRNYDTSELKEIYLNFDPLTYNAFTGGYYKQGDNLWDVTSELLHNNNKKIKTIGINLHHFANAGATPVVQLAFALSIAAEYFNFALEKNISIEKVLSNIHFNIALGTEYFTEISKVRALRYLFAKFAEAYDSKLKDKAKTHIHAYTRRRNKTIYDSYVNMLRTTVEALAGAVGGVDSLSVEEYNIVFSKPDAFAERIAVNQQIIIKEEAFADKVVDPAGGSYYVEKLTVQFIEKAWKLFLEIQEKGGFCDCLHNNFIYNYLDKVISKEQELVNKGKIAILGTNKYPNSNENLKNIKIQKPFEISDIKHKQKNFKTLRVGRLSENFEDLRIKTEKLDKTPQVFLFTYGNKTMRRARADFAGNFFAVAGFDIIDNLGFETIEQGVTDANQKNADIVVLCSSDEFYLDFVKEIKDKFKNKIIVVAGNPKTRTEIENIGIKNFINIKSNIYKELKQYQKLFN